jgi:hypothetical protein
MIPKNFGMVDAVSKSKITLREFEIECPKHKNKKAMFYF